MADFEKHNQAPEGKDGKPSGSLNGADAGQRAGLEDKYPQNLEANAEPRANQPAELPKFNKIEVLAGGKLTPAMQAALKGQWWRAEGYSRGVLFSRKGMDVTEPENGDFKITVVVFDDGEFGLTVYGAKDGDWNINYVELYVTK